VVFCGEFYETKELMAKTGAAFGSAAAQYGPAGLGGHAFHKTVLTTALAFFGLISSFWHVYITLP